MREILIPGMLAHRIRDQIRAYLATTYNIRDARYRDDLEGFLMGEGGIFKGPYLDVKLPFRTASAEAKMPIEVLGPFYPYAHQLRAWERLSSRAGTPRSTIVATGTGSGKTECFLNPILDHVLQHVRSSGVLAILFYPMNALAFDQARRLAKLIADDPRLAGVRAGLIAGEDPDAPEARTGVKAMRRDALIDDRATLTKDPPHILLTNYKMLDVMLQSAEFAPLWNRMQKCTGADRLRYLVFDEIHTYDGAQGADVALLVRRLKTRLGLKQGELTAVGTSATLSSSADGTTRLLAFARRIFGEEFAADAVITEDRLSLTEVFHGITASAGKIPADAPVLDHDLGESITAMIERLARLWLGDGCRQDHAGDRVALGAALMAHPMTHALLAALGGAPRTEAETLASLAAAGHALTSRQLGSFLALLAQARRRVEARAGSGAPALQLPLFHMRVQIWMREVSALLACLGGKGPAFMWNVPHRAPTQAPGIYLPPVFCEECGMAGLACKEARSGGVLDLRDQRGIANARVERAASMRYLFPWSGEAPDLGEGLGTSRLIAVCKSCAQVHLEDAEACAMCRDATQRFLVFAALTTDKSGKAQKDRRRCPSCFVDGSLRMLSARLNTLTSITAGEIFLSRLAPPSGKRLLVFADSVQDASHRAGYLNARTYRFTIRTAIQTTLADMPRDDVPLLDLASHVLPYWEQRLGPDKAVGMLTPLDLAESDAYQDYWDGKRDALRRYLEPRLVWEVYLEYCLRGQVGRTLEKTLSSMATWHDRQGDAKLAAAFTAAVNEPDLGAVQDAGREAFSNLWRGVARRLIHKGAVALPGVFDDYRAKGSAFELSKRRIPWIGNLPRGRVGEGMELGQLPNFPTTGRDERIFDFLGGAEHGRSWAHDWLVKCLGRDVSAPEATTILSGCYEAWADAGLLDRVKGPHGTASYGLPAAAVAVSRAPVSLRCDVCLDAVRVASFQREACLGSPCRMMRCAGRYRPAETTATDAFYRDLYARGQVGRIFAVEHTGILGRAEREELETRFKADDAARRPVDENLLSCTSTLEMGIDIGDLGATVAAGLPRSAASYQQRIGRAGRTTGSALIAAIAQSRPRDLLFFDEPRELVAGHIDPPGCFLDAPDILRRQLAAFILESHAESLRGKAKKLTLKQITDDFVAPSREGFWSKIEALLGPAGGVAELARFRAACHLSDIPAATWDKLANDWLTPDPQSRRTQLHDRLYKLVSEFISRKRELDEEETAYRQIVKDLEANPNLTDEKKAELEDAHRFLGTIRADLEALGAREGLHGYLVKRGFLPNYAFGDDDVELVAYRRLRRPVDGKVFSQTSFVRSAATAIRDLAPGNVFYGGGQRVEINTLDLGKDSKRHVEDWRFCPDCAHLDRNRDEEAGKRCPVCTSGNWGDAASRLRMVKLKRVKSVIGLDGDGAADEAETRHREIYKTRKFFDGKAAAVWGVNDEELTMGLEFVPRMKMREVNFGFADQRRQASSSIRIGLEDLPAGFLVCHACGRLSDAKGEIRHTQACPRNSRTPKVQAKKVGAVRPGTSDAPLLLYRELESEAVRVHLPVRTFQSKEKMASYEAALMLGLRAHFGGAPSHLSVEREEGRSPDDGEPQYALVLFDSVPGGSGFMKSLTTKDSFFAMAEKALKLLEECACASDEARDGCIRCVYGAVAQRDIPLVSRRVAVQFLAQTLARKDDFQDIKVSDLRERRSTESELEDMLADVFDRCRSDETLSARLKGLGIEVRQATEKLASNGVGTLELVDLRTGKAAAWRIELQRTLKDRKAGINTRPDFVLERVGDGSDRMRKIALYTDGFAYHASPAAKDRLRDDCERRTALSLADGSTTMRVYSLDWTAVADWFEGRPADALRWFALAAGEAGGRFKLDPLALLFCVLARGVENASGGVDGAEVVDELKTLLVSVPTARANASGVAQPSASIARLERAGVRQEGLKNRLFGLAAQGQSLAAFAAKTAASPEWSAIEWRFSEADRAHPDFPMIWRRFLATCNVLGLVSRGVAAAVEIVE